MKNLIYITCALLSFSITYPANASNSIGVYCWEMISTLMEPGYYDDSLLCLDLENKSNVAYGVTGYKFDNKTQIKDPVFGAAVFDETSGVYRLKFNGITVAEINPSTLNGKYKSGALYGELYFVGVQP